MYGNAAITSGTTAAFAPIVFPTIARVSGITIANRMINGTERSRLTITPATLLNSGTGRMPSLSVTTSATPSGMPIK